MNNSKKLSLFRNVTSNSKGLSDIPSKDTLLNTLVDFRGPSIRTGSGGGSLRAIATETDTDCTVHTDGPSGPSSDFLRNDDCTHERDTLMPV